MRLAVELLTIGIRQLENRMHRNESETLQNNDGETMHGMRLGRVAGGRLFQWKHISAEFDPKHEDRSGF